MTVRSLGDRRELAREPALTLTSSTANLASFCQLSRNPKMAGINAGDEVRTHVTFYTLPFLSESGRNLFSSRPSKSQ